MKYTFFPRLTGYTNSSTHVFFLLILALFFGLHAPAHAQELSLGIYPPILQIQAAPPATFKAPITIINNSDNTKELAISFKPFTASTSDNGSITFVNNTQIPTPDALILQKMHLFENDHIITSVVLAPKQSKKLFLQIELPKDEPLADYYIAITFVSKAPETTTKSSSQTPGGIATNILLSIGPKGSAQGEITQFNAPGYMQHGPVPFTVLVKNTGEHVIAPVGQITIINMFGQTIGKVDLLPVNILKNSSRYIPDTKEDSKYGTYYTTHPVAMWPDTVLLGPYTARVKVALSAQGPLLIKDTHFIALPLEVVIGAFFGILGILLLVERIQKYIREK